MPNDRSPLTAVFKGVVQVREENGMYTPLRLTDRQLARYREIPRCCYPYATAGIKLEFVTDAPVISFGYQYGATWTFWEDAIPQFDVYENDLLTDIFPFELESAAPVQMVRYTRRERAPSKITVYFPHNAELRVCTLSLGNCTPTPAKDRRLLVLGDSISQGLMGNSASLCYTALVERFFDFELLNQSVGGDCFDADALDPALPFQPTDVLVALGTNDVFFLKDLPVIRQNIAAYFVRVRELYGAARVRFVTPPFLTDAEEIPNEFGMVLEVSREIERKCREYGWQCVDGMKLVPHHPRFFSDHAHPNDLGFAQYALHLIRQMI